MWNRLSTGCALLISVGCVELFVGGCVDARGQFDEFGARVTDAAPQIDSQGIEELPESSGQYLLSLLTLTKTTRFIADVDLTKNSDGTGVIGVELRSLTIKTGQLTEIAATVATGNAVGINGAFDAHFEFVLPADANPITNSRLNLIADMHGQLRTSDFFCGTVTGTVVETGTPLDGTTFGAVRVPEGTLGDALPPAIISCDDEPDGSDAGVPDAAAPEEPDAAVPVEPDAAVPVEPDAAP
jgi:hypothetical protein